MLLKSKRGWSKKGERTIWELVSIIVVIAVFVLCVVFVWLLKDKGFEGALATIKNLLRFGRA